MNRYLIFPLLNAMSQITEQPKILLPLFFHIAQDCLEISLSTIFDTLGMFMAQSKAI